MLTVGSLFSGIGGFDLGFVVENVSALRSRGLDRVLGDLAACGYDAEWDCIPACAVGAPHRRDRIWIVAYPQHGRGRGQQPQWGEAERDPESRGDGENGAVAYPSRGGQPEYGHELRPSGCGTETRFPAPGGADVAYPERSGLAGWGTPRDVAGATGTAEAEAPERQRLRDAADHRGAAVADAHRAGRPEQWRSQPVLPQLAAIERSDWWRVEPPVGRVAHGVPLRVDRLRGLGNALVPQIATWIGTQILEDYRRQEGGR